MYEDDSGHVQNSIGHVLHMHSKKIFIDED